MSKIETVGIACIFKRVDELTQYIGKFDLTHSLSEFTQHCLYTILPEASMPRRLVQRKNANFLPPTHDFLIFCA